MRQSVVLAALAVLAFVAILAGWHPRLITAQQPGGAPAPVAPAPASVPLPITQVVLFSSGVGYFQREGEVEGETRIDLAFPADNVNDLLKSLVLQDKGGGKIKPVSYENQEPAERTLKSFGIDLSNNPTFGQILNQARGQKVEVVMQQTATTQPGTLSGVIIGMEDRPNTTGVGQTEMLNLQCVEGLRCVALDQVQRVRFLNPVLDSELRRALEVLATVHDSQKKRVGLGFSGAGKRRVRVGYVVENPIWKTSYRLVLDGDGQPHLQGWAMVENTTDEDWNDLRVVLVAGRPMSFQMDLYQPLFVPRPVVEPEHFASLRPPAYSGALANEGPAVNAGIAGLGGGGNLGFAGGPGNLGVGGSLGGNYGLQGQAGNLGGAQFGLQGGFINRYQFNQGQTGGQAGTPRLSYEELQKRRQEMHEAKDEAKMVGNTLTALDPTEGVVSAATGQGIGSHYRYVIDQTVTLPRQKSAMLPIVDGKVQGSRVSIYNEKVQSQFPLLGLKVKNTSGQHLTQGPITVYEEGQYAGDARILDLQPDEERLISYAMDLATEVKTKTRRGTGKVVAAKVTGDHLNVSFYQRETKTYLIKNRSKQDRQLIIEHPMREDWVLAEPAKPSERSRDFYRFEVTVPAGKTVSFKVIEEQPQASQFELREWAGTPRGRTAAGLGVEISSARQDTTQTLQKVQIDRGVLKASYQMRQAHNYVLANRTADPIQLLVEHRVEAQWKLIAPANVEEFGPNLHRLRETVLVGKSAALETIEERERTDDVALATADEKVLRKFQESTIPSPAVKTVLQKIATQREALAKTRRTIADQDEQLKGIADDQTRLRANLDKVPPTSAAYKRYLTKFDEQETEIEKLQMQIKELKKAEKQQLKESTDYLAELVVE